MGLNFVTISLDSSYVKNQFLGPSRVVGNPFGPSFPFFPTFFYPVFCLCSCFYFFIFLIFCSFLHILIYFNVFHFLFSFFQMKKYLLFFFLVFLSFFFLLALVSEFNCFLRSRCSMEMWCLDDIGRDSWDWVEPLAWVRACFNSQSGVEAPRLLKRSLPRLYYCCCVVVVLLFGCCVVCCVLCVLCCCCVLLLCVVVVRCCCVLLCVVVLCVV